MINRRFLAALLLISGLASATEPALTREVLVLASATTSLGPRYSKAKGFAVFNHGPNTIHCAIGASGVANKTWTVPAGGWVSMPVPYPVVVSCIASTADQVTGAATTMVDLP